MAGPLVAVLPAQGDDELRFRFFGGTDWAVQLLAQPVWRLPFVSDARGVSRPIGLLRHFVVRGDPLSQP